jgi:small subunit ribosomal protein S7e
MVWSKGRMIVKIRKAKDQQPTKLEEAIAQHILDIQNNAQVEWRAELNDLYILSVKEVELNNKKVVVIFVPFRLIKEFRRVQAKLIRELEKKLSQKQVLVVAQRRILPPASRLNRTATQKRPNSRTLTAVHDAILDDMLYPVEVAGKRIRVKTDGTKQHKILLDPKDEQAVEGRTDAYTAVYKKFTGRDIVFSFPAVAKTAEH